MVVAAASLEISCHLFYMHAVAASGAFKEMQALKGFPIEGCALLAMALFSLLFLFLKVPPWLSLPQHLFSHCCSRDPALSSAEVRVSESLSILAVS